MVRLKKTKKAKAELEKKSKDRIKDVVTHLTPTNSLSKDDDDDRPQWQKDVLFGRRRKMEAIEEDGEANAEETAKENGNANHESGHERTITRSMSVSRTTTRSRMRSNARLPQVNAILHRNRVKPLDRVRKRI